MVVVKTTLRTTAPRCRHYATLPTLRHADNRVRSFRKWLHREHRDENATVDLLITFLQTETELEEHLATKSNSANVSTNKSKHSTVNQVCSSSNDRCALCDKSKHRYVDCQVFTDYSPQQRFEAVKRLGRCYTCLAPKHRDPRDCRYRRWCMTCNKSHHTLLACVSISTPSSQSQNTVNPVPSLNPNAADYQPAERLTNQPTSTLKYSPSTHVELLSKDGSWHRAVALFDSGSDVTLIKSDLVKKLILDR